MCVTELCNTCVHIVSCVYICVYVCMRVFMCKLVGGVGGESSLPHQTRLFHVRAQSPLYKDGVLLPEGRDSTAGSSSLLPAEGAPAHSARPHPSPVQGPSLHTRPFEVLLSAVFFRPSKQTRQSQGGAQVIRLFRGRESEWGSHQIRQPFATVMRDSAERQVGLKRGEGRRGRRGTTCSWQGPGSGSSYRAAKPASPGWGPISSPKAFPGHRDGLCCGVAVPTWN